MTSQYWSVLLFVNTSALAYLSLWNLRAYTNQRRESNKPGNKVEDSFLSVSVQIIDLLEWHSGGHGSYLNSLWQFVSLYSAVTSWHSSACVIADTEHWAKQELKWQVNNSGISRKISSCHVHSNVRELKKPDLILRRKQGWDEGRDQRPGPA